jgi:hypothetical protein
MRRLGTHLTTISIAAALLFPVSAPARGQDQQEQEEGKPKPAGQAFPSVGNLDENPNEDRDASGLRPDNRPLTGVQYSTLGAPEIRHSYWAAGFQSSNTLRSTTLDQATRSGWNSTSYLVGNVSLRHAWGNAELSLNYSGGGYFSTDHSQGSGYLQLFGAVQTFQWRRWQLSLLDEFSYLPQSLFGFGVGSGIYVPGIGGSLAPALPGLQNNYQPNQSIFTSFGRRYSNSFVTEALYALSRRSSIDVAGSRGTLRFLGAGNFDSDDTILSVGYNYAISRKDTVGLLYRFTAYRYPANPQALNDHAVHAAYGRKITGRLALQLYLGPEFATFHVPIAAARSHTGMSWGASLSHSSGSNNLSLTYSHGLANGSGIQIGSRADQLETGLARQVSRYWQASTNFGYARNKGLGSSGASSTSQALNSYYFGIGLRRPVGRDSSLLFGYSAQIQTSNQPVCAAGTCSTSYAQHQITVGFSWHTSPIVLR